MAIAIIRSIGKLDIIRAASLTQTYARFSCVLSSATPPPPLEENPKSSTINPKPQAHIEAPISNTEPHEDPSSSLRRTFFFGGGSHLLVKEGLEEAHAAHMEAIHGQFCRGSSGSQSLLYFLCRVFNMYKNPKPCALNRKPKT